MVDPSLVQLGYIKYWIIIDVIPSNKSYFFIASQAWISWVIHLIHFKYLIELSISLTFIIWPKITLFLSKIELSISFNTSWIPYILIIQFFFHLEFVTLVFLLLHLEYLMVLSELFLSSRLSYLIYPYFWYRAWHLIEDILILHLELAWMILLYKWNLYFLLQVALSYILLLSSELSLSAITYWIWIHELS